MSVRMWIRYDLFLQENSNQASEKTFYLELDSETIAALYSQPEVIIKSTESSSLNKNSI